MLLVLCPEVVLNMEENLQEVRKLSFLWSSFMLLILFVWFFSVSRPFVLFVNLFFSSGSFVLRASALKAWLWLFPISLPELGSPAEAQPELLKQWPCSQSCSVPPPCAHVLWALAEAGIKRKIQQR